MMVENCVTIISFLVYHQKTYIGWLLIRWLLIRWLRNISADGKGNCLNKKSDLPPKCEGGLPLLSHTFEKNLIAFNGSFEAVCLFLKLNY